MAFMVLRNYTDFLIKPVAFGLTKVNKYNISKSDHLFLEKESIQPKNAIPGVDLKDYYIYKYRPEYHYFLLNQISGNHLTLPLRFVFLDRLN